LTVAGDGDGERQSKTKPAICLFPFKFHAPCILTGYCSSVYKYLTIIMIALTRVWLAYGVRLSPVIMMMC